jgi:membrane associated rhomboid family serine protease
MERPGRHLSRPLYEGLPWIYLGAGVLAVIVSYLLAAHGFLSLLLGLAGVLAVLGGFVVLLRRRDYRALRSRYADPDSLTGPDES